MNLWKEKSWTPMLLKEIDKPFNSKDYLFEIKFDGIRTCIFVSKDHFEIRNRNHTDMTNLYPELKNIQKYFSQKTILDGEIIAVENDKPSFSKLQKRSHLKDKNRIKTESENNPVIFIAFDILYLDKDLTNLDLLKRKEILSTFQDSDFFIKSPVYLENGIKLFKFVKKQKLEGIIAKKIDSTYEINTRNDNWIKIKNLIEEDFYIGGYEKKKNNYISLYLGEKKNNKLYYVGNASLTNNTKLYHDILNLKVINKNPFCDFEDKNINYVSLKIKCKVKYLERTQNNHLRQPIIVRRTNNE